MTGMVGGPGSRSPIFLSLLDICQKCTAANTATMANSGMSSGDDKTPL